MKTNSYGYYSMSIPPHVNPKRFILQVYGIENVPTFIDITPYFYTFAILYRTDTNMSIGIKAYKINTENRYLEPVDHEVNIRIFYIKINA